MSTSRASAERVEPVGLPRWVWGLAALLGAAWATLLLAEDGRRTTPTIGSPRPSGAMAFARLLRAAGYQVRAEAHRGEALPPEALAVGFAYEEAAGEGSAGELGFGMRRLERHVRRGGRAIVFWVPEADFDRVSALFLEGAKSIRNPFRADSPRLEITAPDERSGFRAQVLAISGAVPDGPSVFLWVDEADEPHVEARAVGDGFLLLVRPGLIATNRLIDKRDNAAFLLQLVRDVAPPGREIVFVESLWGEGSSLSLVSAVGPWLDAARWQLVLTFLVVVYSAGRRFGLPELDPPRQRGGRDLVEAFALLMRRSRHPDLALGLLASAADQEIRRSLRLPADADRSERDARLPEGLRRALAAAEQGAEGALGRGPAAEREVLERARLLEREMEAFLGRRDFGPRRGAKR